MYAKVFEQIFDSSIANDYQLRQFFVDLLVLAEMDGVVDMTPEAISARTRIPLEKVLGFLVELSKPDLRSRSDKEEGRRIVLLDSHRDWGWQIVNYDTYRKIASEEQRRERTKNRTRKWRESRQMQNGDAPVTHGDACDAMQRQRQRQRQKNIEEVHPLTPATRGDPLELPDKLKTQQFVAEWARWQTYRRGFKKVKDWVSLFQSQIEYLSRFDEPTATEMLKQSIRNGWQGVFELKNNGHSSVKPRRGPNI